MTERNRQFLITLRAALIMALNAIDDMLGRPRTVPCRDERMGLQRVKSMVE